MKGNRSLGCFGGLAVVVVGIAALALIRRFVPSIFSAFAWVAGIAVAILIVVLILIIVLANKATKALKKETPKPAPDPSPQTQTNTTNLPPEQAAVINKGRSDLLTVRKILAKIHNPEICKSGYDVCSSLEKLLQALREKPEKIKNSRQFLNYYIPTLAEVLTKYHRLEANGVVTQDNTEKVENFLIDFRKASGKQYQSLFEDDKLDMTVDIEAMAIAIKRDGLLDEDDFVQGPVNEASIYDEPPLIIDAPENSVVVEDDMTVIDAVNQAAEKENETEKEKDLVH